MWKKILDDLYLRVWVAKKSSLLGLALLVADVVIQNLLTMNNPTVHLIASILSTLLVLYKGKLTQEDAAAKPSLPTGTMLVLLLGSLLLASPARAQEVEPVPSFLPSITVCNLANTVCLAPAVSIVPYVLDFDSGSIGRNQRILFQFGEGLTMTKGSLAFGGDLLVGTSDSGGWNAALMGKVGPKGGLLARLGPVVEHTANGYHWSLGIGGGF